MDVYIFDQFKKLFSHDLFQYFLLLFLFILFFWKSG